MNRKLVDQLLNRRQVLGLALTGAGVAVLGNAPMLWAETFRAPAPAAALKPGRAKSVIQIWMWGGPSTIDGFDPKPQAGYDYCGPLDKIIETNVPGISLNASLPLLAQVADKFSLIRSMTHGQNGHETAAYLMQTGRMPDRVVYPSLGAVVAKYKGYDAGHNSLIPPYIVLTQSQGRFSEEGFLGPTCKPFCTGGDPNAPRFAVEGIVSKNITDDRQIKRRALMNELDTLGQAMTGCPEFDQHQKAQNAAFDIVLGETRKVFDLSQESDEMRDAYGRSTFGQSCLMARRLVEQGVPYITINYGGWDTHKQHFQIMERRLPEMDRALSQLLKDLSDRGLLDQTIVWWGGEFGRTPKVDWDPPWNGGRGHYGQCFSCLVAGGGFKGGHVVGESDEFAEKVVSRPVYPADMLGSIYELLGINPTGPLQNPRGEDLTLLPPPSENKMAAGLLREIMRP